MPTFERYMLYQWPRLCEERPQLLEVADVMEGFLRNGRTGDVLNVSMPTRFGKSLLATSLSVWLLAFVNPSTRILRASYSADLAETFSQQVRGQYLKVFEDGGRQVPSIAGTRARWSIDGRDEAAHIGVGIGGGLTGFGCDLAIVDDTAKNMLEATSAAHSRQLSVFKESVLLGRLENERKIINVGTRWTVNDWFSMWPDAEEYVLPAMVDGRSVCEAWKTTAVLELERSRVSEGVWNAQYMQRPTETGRVRLFEGWRPVWADGVPEGTHVVVIDPATDYGRDFFVMGDYVFAGGMVCLCDMFAEQAASPERAAAWLKGRDYSVAWIECNGAGSNVMQKMRAAGCKALAGFSTNADKYSRAYVQAEAVRNYLRVVRGCDVKAVEELARQMDCFPVTGEAIHDDLVDNVVMAFERIYRI